MNCQTSVFVYRKNKKCVLENVQVGTYILVTFVCEKWMLYDNSDYISGQIILPRNFRRILVHSNARYILLLYYGIYLYVCYIRFCWAGLYALHQFPDTGRWGTTLSCPKSKDGPPIYTQYVKILINRYT